MKIPKLLCLGLMLALSSPIFSQIPGYAYDKESTLCLHTADSDLIVTGRIVSRIWIVDPEKKKAEDERWARNMEDFVNFPKPEKFLLGALYTLDLSEVLLDTSNSNSQSQISIFVKGNRAFPLLDDNAPYFLDNTKYLIYLRSIALSEIDDSSKAMNPGKQEMNDFKIQTDKLYEVTSRYFGYFPFDHIDPDVLADAYRFVAEKDQKCPS